MEKTDKLRIQIREREDGEANAVQDNERNSKMKNPA